MFEGILNCTTFQLDNGLRVVLHPDHRLPLVAVDLWYRVGSRDDPPGRTGFAHLFEHLMFMGTPRVPGDGFDRLLEAHGGSNNASTSQDRTAYTSWGPSGLLNTLLWLEADRMRDLGRCLDQERLDVQREVVRNERRQSYEMRPYGHTWLELGSLIYPVGHPYRHPVIGSHEDIAAATVDDIRTFFDTWYVPKNATLVVGGDFDEGRTRETIESLFGSIPAGSQPSRPETAPHHLRHRVERTLEDDVPASRVILAWTSPARFAPGDAEMDLAADLLGEGAASRLEQALVHREPLAQDVEAAQVHGELGSEFVIEATALPGVAPERIEEVIRGELVALAKEGPTKGELERLRTLTEVDFVRASQELSERTDDIHAYLADLGAPDRLAWDFERYGAVDVDSMRRRISEHLDPDHVAALTIAPGRRTTTSASHESDREEPDHDATAPMPDVPLEAVPQAPKAWSSPPPALITKNGWHLATDRAALAVVKVLVPFGAERDAEGEEGRCGLASEVMSEAAGGRDAEALDDTLDRLGADLSIAPGRHTFTLGVSTLARNLAPAMEILADILHRPDFVDEDFARVREITLAEIAQRARQPDHIASVTALAHIMRGVDGQGHPILGHERTVAPLTLDDLRETWRDIASSVPKSRWVSGGVALPQDVASMITETLGVDAEAVTEPPAPLLDGSPSTPLEVLLVDIPDAAQSVIRFLRRGPRLAAHDLPATELANAVLGGTFMSRLNRNLRERHGFTYGAGSTVWSGARSGFVGASTSVDRHVTARATRQLLLELEGLASTPPSAEERDAALAVERAERVRAMESLADAVSTLLPWAEAGLPPEAAARHIEALHAVTVDDMARAAHERLRPSEGVLVVVGDTSAFEKELADVVPTTPRLVLPPA